MKIGGYTPESARQFRVIDGQQRLTTLQLLIAAAAAEIESVGISDSAALLRDLTINSSKPHSSNENKYKITYHRHKQGHNYERFGDVMTASLTGTTTEDITGHMVECYEFFRSATKNWLRSPNINIGLAASALATTLIAKLNLVGIYLDVHEKEHVIFEALNARGESLTEWDKIKNYLLHKADEEPELNQDAFYENYLDRFDGPWWRTLAGRGAQRQRMDIFVDYWLESKKKEPVTVRRVYRDFEKHVDNENQPLESLIKQLIQDSEYFKQFVTIEFDASKKSREALFHYRREEIDLGAIWPLLLQLQRINSQPSERHHWLALLESYFIRRLITGYQARSYDQITLDLLGLLPAANDNDTTIQDVLLAQLLKYNENASLWPSDDALKLAVINRHLPQYAQRLVLTAIEQHLTTEKAGNLDLPSTIQIEHIMPRKWETHWPLFDSIDQVLAESNRNAWINTLGNLTLLNGPLNASIRDAQWSIKRSAIQCHDNLFLNRRLLEEAGDEWTEVGIQRRGEWMYSKILEIWPRG